MQKKILKNIRFTSIKTLIIVLIFGIFPNYGFFYALTGGAGKDTILLLLLFAVIAVSLDYVALKYLYYIYNPLCSDVFKKYGSIDEVAKIFEEIENTKEYEDKNIVIARNYIFDKKDFDKLVACKDILSVHKLVHKTNYVTNGYSVVVTDKYGHESRYLYGVKDEKKVDNLILTIGMKSENSTLGYTKEARNHIKQNKVDLPKNEYKNKKDNIYKCPNCNEIIAYGDKFCKNCSCKLDWE